jgi:hypothetical protein
MKRALGSLTLAVFIVSLIAPRAVSRPATVDCPSAPATGIPALASALDHGSDHCGPDLGSCLSMPGCMTGTLAIGAASAVVVVPPGLFVISASPAPHAGDLYGAGPPTPPPNLI